MGGSVSKLFDDPEYKRMSTDEESWLELAIEPFRFHLNDMIPLLPEKIELNFEDILSMVRHANDSRWMSVDLRDILGPVITKIAGKDMSSKEILILVKLYEMTMESDTEINFVDKTLSHPIVISKIAYEIPEDEIKQIVADLAVDELKIRNIPASSGYHSTCISRMNEVLDLIGFEARKIRTSRSTQLKNRAIERRIKKIIEGDEWRIRSYDIVKDFCNNIGKYINEGNVHCLMNITRLKCMTHKGAPIYSMEEIK